MLEPVFSQAKSLADLPSDAVAVYRFGKALFRHANGHLEGTVFGELFHLNPNGSQGIHAEGIPGFKELPDDFPAFQALVLAKSERGHEEGFMVLGFP